MVIDFGDLQHERAAQVTREEQLRIHVAKLIERQRESAKQVVRAAAYLGHRLIASGYTPNFHVDRRDATAVPLRRLWSGLNGVIYTPIPDDRIVNTRIFDGFLLEKRIGPDRSSSSEPMAVWATGFNQDGEIVFTRPPYSGPWTNPVVDPSTDYPAFADETRFFKPNGVLEHASEPIGHFNPEKAHDDAIARLAGSLASLANKVGVDLSGIK